MNLMLSKVNNYIINFININNNYNNFINDDIIKNYISLTTLFDEKILNNNKYIEYFEYFPKISSEYITNSNNFIAKYKSIINYTHNNTSNIYMIPIGKYVKFNYINIKSNSDNLDINDVLSINISNIINYNFCLLIMLPYNMNIDEDIFSYDIYSNDNMHNYIYDSSQKEL
jgi:hypothetical protein